jgi:hypothetical protein
MAAKFEISKTCSCDVSGVPIDHVPGVSLRRKASGPRRLPWIRSTGMAWTSKHLEHRGLRGGSPGLPILERGGRRRWAV